ncbi:MAG: S41 family peptidase [Gammaproteobacteria bacterium]|nr:S41 family peptidase [Gammaproteobacteria bacterium]
MPQTPPSSQFTSGSFESSANFSGMCAIPRIGTQFPDAQGTSTDENNWLRSWSNELYLWYDEIVDRNPANYPTSTFFDLMKTTATTASGAPKDQFHFTIPTDEWEALSQSGVSAGYGAKFVTISATPPREIVVAYTTANSPATAAGLTRGVKVLEVDGISVANGADVDTLNAGLFPSAAGVDHEFVVQDPVLAERSTITMRSATLTAQPVRIVNIYATPAGPVGHLFFTEHIAPAEQDLIDAIETLAAAGITDLLLDIRYNGGGFLDIANELAFMIAGGSAAAGRVFLELQFNDKHRSLNPVTGQALSADFFYTTSQGYSAPQGNPLPSLNLDRVFVLTGPGTCSASEAIINGLRGIDFEVIQIGSSTCGKPYGFYPPDNCGTTYFSIQFKGVNAKGFGDYPDGFAPQNLGARGAVLLPGCAVADDFDNPVGGFGEVHAETALDYRAGFGCPAATSSAPTGLVNLAQKTVPGEAIEVQRTPGAVKRW